MKILVFGAAGFVGQHVLASLEGGEDDVLATDKAVAKKTFGHRYTKLDLLDQEGVMTVMQGMDAVVHLATSGLTASLGNPVYNTRVNIEGTINILEAARKCNVERILFTSASSVVGRVRQSPVSEDHPCVPLTPYAVSKLACEHYLRVYQELYGVKHMVFRLFNVYGPGQYAESGGLIPNVLGSLRDGKPVRVFGDGAAVRDFVYISDIADFVPAALHSREFEGIVNVGTGAGHTIMDVIRTAEKVTGFNAKIDYQPQRPGEIMDFVADTEKLRRTFGMVPQTTLEEGVRRTWGWLSGV